MKITKYNIPSVMLDNDMQMFNLLFKVIEKVDSSAQINITKTLDSYKIVVIPSKKKLKNFIRVELQELSVILGDIFEFPKTSDYLQNVFITISTK